MYGAGEGRGGGKVWQRTSGVQEVRVRTWTLRWQRSPGGQPGSTLKGRVRKRAGRDCTACRLVVSQEEWFGNGTSSALPLPHPPPTFVFFKWHLLRSWEGCCCCPMHLRSALPSNPPPAFLFFKWHLLLLGGGVVVVVLVTCCCGNIRGHILVR